MPFLKLKLAHSGRMWVRSSPASLPRSPFQVAVTYSMVDIYIKDPHVNFSPYNVNKEKALLQPSQA